MKLSDYEKAGKYAIEWGVKYRENMAQYPVMAQTKPGDIVKQIPDHMPQLGEDIEDLLADMDKIILPGITHWQHPRFFAYFPSNAPLASVLAQQFSAVMGSLALLWQTSPAASELEEKMTQWLQRAVNLSPDFMGVIQDGASSSTLIAVLTMRERATQWQSNKTGLAQQKTLRIYVSEHAHSSVERAVGFAGIGRENLVKINGDEGALHGMNKQALQQAIEADIKHGYQPVGIVLCTGSTSIGSCDDIEGICDVAEKYNLYTHLDAAWAGAAMVCPEFQHYWQGVNRLDSLVLNPHKWLGGQHDCSLHYFKNTDDVRKTLSLQPEYLKTIDMEDIKNYSDYSLGLGRNFRALKLWFLFRIYGLEYIQNIFRNHVSWAQYLQQRFEQTPNFQIITPCFLSLFTFRYLPQQWQGDVNDFTQKLVKIINDDGRIYITQSIYNNMKMIRFQIGTYDCTKKDVDIAYQTITELAKKLDK
ncbi:MAG: aspartate aminotransferase family protein [Alphaproteobacteria bacterium]|nr:aspartate aminotransferase family protein [Alphaproteobacteria bacterium]